VDLESSTIGQAIECIVQVVDEHGQIRPSGETGELRVFGLNIMPGYYRRENLTEAVIRNGWFYTGDIAVIDETGKVELKGRQKEIIKTADGLLVYTAEIETILESHPLVQEATVLPILEAEKEKMLSFVVLIKSVSDPEPIRQELKQYIMERIGDRNIPVEIRFSDSLPRNANGKVLKTALTL
jgi:long-chain acyl-CoA synthetase